MTREDRLYSMRMTDLVAVAEKLGVKIDKKGAKSKAVEKILAAESAKAEAVSAPEVVEPIMDLDNPVEPANALSADESLENAVVDPDSAYAGDGTPLAEVGKEIAKEAKAKAKKAKAEKKAKTTEKKETAPAVDPDALAKYFEANESKLSLVPRNKPGVFSLKYSKRKRAVTIYVSKNCYTMYFNSDAVAKAVDSKLSKGNTKYYAKVNESELVTAIKLFEEEV